MKTWLAVFAVASVIASGTVDAADIKMLASGATKEVIEELIPSFEKSADHKIVATYTGSANIRKRIDGGEVFDLVVLGASDVDSYIKAGKLAAGPRVDLMKSGVGIAVRSHAPKPDVSTSEALKKALLSAKSIGYSTGPSGVYLVGMFERLAIIDQIKPKMKQVASGEPVGGMIAKGEAEIGFQQVSELIHFPGIAYLGPLPAELQSITVFSAGINSGATQPEAAKALVKYLTSPIAVPVIKRHGMEPG